MARATPEELAAEAKAWADGTKTTEGWVDAPEAVPRYGTTSISLRMPDRMLAAFKELARRDGTPYQVFIKQCLRDRLVGVDQSYFVQPWWSCGEGHIHMRVDKGEPCPACDLTEQLAAMVGALRDVASGACGGGCSCCPAEDKAVEALKQFEAAGGLEFSAKGSIPFSGGPTAAALSCESHPMGPVDGCGVCDATRELQTPIVLTVAEPPPPEVIVLTLGDEYQTIPITVDQILAMGRGESLSIPVERKPKVDPICVCVWTLHSPRGSRPILDGKCSECGGRVGSPIASSSGSGIDDSEV